MIAATKGFGRLRGVLYLCNPVQHALGGSLHRRGQHALEQISRNLSGNALAQVVGAGLVALHTTGQQPARLSRRLASVMKSSRSLTKFSEVHDRPAFGRAQPGRLGGS
jgi:hypothetical protein